MELIQNVQHYLMHTLDTELRITETKCNLEENNHHILISMDTIRIMLPALASNSYKTKPTVPNTQHRWMTYQQENTELGCVCVWLHCSGWL